MHSRSTFSGERKLIIYQQRSRARLSPIRAYRTRFHHPLQTHRTPKSSRGLQATEIFRASVDASDYCGTRGAQDALARAERARRGLRALHRFWQWVSRRDHRRREERAPLRIAREDFASSGATVSEGLQIDGWGSRRGQVRIVSSSSWFDKRHRSFTPLPHSVTGI